MGERYTCWKTTHLDSPAGSGPCEHCGRRRCTGGGERRCRKFPSEGVTVCISHGGMLPNVKEKSLSAAWKRKLSGSAFYPDAVEIVDPGDALITIASRLMVTSEQIGMRLDEQLREYDDRKAFGDSEACPCCGAGAEINVLDKNLLEMWKFSIRETGSLLSTVEKLGLKEREVRMQEAQVMMVAQALDTMFNSLGLTEAQQLAGRQTLLETLRTLEAKQTRPKHPSSPVEGTIIKA